MNASGLIILDEPTDGFSKRAIESSARCVLCRLSCKQIILVSHERELEAFSDRVFRIVKEGSVSKVLAGWTNLLEYELCCIRAGFITFYELICFMIKIAAFDNDCVISKYDMLEFVSKAIGKVKEGQFWKKNIIKVLASAKTTKKERLPPKKAWKENILLSRVGFKQAKRYLCKNRTHKRGKTNASMNCMNGASRSLWFLRPYFP